jgi:hypothetical protein
MGRRIARLAIAVLVATGAVPSIGAAAVASPTAAPLSVRLTLEANPGSTRTGDNTVLVRPGIAVTLSSAGEVTTQAAGQCPRGWLCAWPDYNFGGGMLAIQQGVYISYGYWWYNVNNGAVMYDDWQGGPGAEWRSFANNITSVYNNTNSAAWAPFYSYRNHANYYAANGSPAPYVGDTWNNSFTAACAC